MSSFRSPLPRILLLVALVLLGLGLAAWLVPGEITAVKEQLLGFPDSDVVAHSLRPVILRAMCFLPALAGFAYCLGGTLDRYIVRQFLATFLICLAALAMIWFLMDLSDKISDFRDADNPPKTMVAFYTTRAPAVLQLLLPYCLLLSLLHSVGKLSTNREIIAMIQSGRGVIRIALPLFVAGGLFSLLSLGMNYHWAPTAEGRVDDILKEATGKLATRATEVLYRDPTENRLWMIGSFPPDYQMGKPLQDVEITTTRADRTLESRIFSKRAFWNRETREWTFEEPLIGKFEPQRPAVYERRTEPLVEKSWPETPWQLIKPGLAPGYLGIPDLSSWLTENIVNKRFADPAPYLTQWHYRWALPFINLVTVLLATPLAIHFARRGPNGGIFLAVVLAALMMLFSNISTALGESGCIRPALGAWLPNIVFGCLGLYLFRRRITGRPIYLLLRRLIPGND